MPVFGSVNIASIRSIVKQSICVVPRIIIQIVLQSVFLIMSAPDAIVFDHMSKGDKSKKADLGSYRDTAQSLWVSIILAFVLRAFVVEAFIIPTGSMAPTLLGEHWSLQCPSCGYEYNYGGAGDVVQAGRVGRVIPTPPMHARCPNCQYSYPADVQRRFLDNGDRVLVLKYLYELSEPQPWDVVVFKNPQDNRQNYIKRLIGLPGEIIEIVHGNVFVAQAPGIDQVRPIKDLDLKWNIRRKPHRVQQEMWQVIFENDYQPDESWRRRGVAPYWQADDAWQVSNHQREFAFNGENEGRLRFITPRREIFTPLYGYNNPGLPLDENDVVGDLRLACVLAPHSSTGTAVLELSSMGFDFKATVDVTGRVALSMRSESMSDGGWSGDADIEPLKPGKQYEVELEFVDFLATLRINGREVITNEPARYPADPYNWLLRKIADEQRWPTPELAISASNGKMTVKHLSICRDVFYTTHELNTPPSGPLGQYARELDAASRDPDNKLFSADNPFFRPVEGTGWGNIGKPIWLRKHQRARADLDEFFVLGDNSPQSLDSRGWVLASPTLRLYDEEGGFQYQMGTVPRYNMIGRAFFVYWPAGHRIPGLPRLPLVPDVGRMRLIR